MTAEDNYEAICEILDKLQPDLGPVEAAQQIREDLLALAAYVEVADYEGTPPSIAAVGIAIQYEPEMGG